MRKKKNSGYPKKGWSHRAKRGAFLIGLLVAIAVAGAVAMSG
jgi:hypothetical protein